MKDGKKKGEDVLIPGMPQEDGSVPFVHYREDGIVAGSLTDLKDGRPGQRPCRLVKHEDRPGYWVDWADGSGPPPAPEDGPIMVNSKAYRDNWGRIFSKPNLFGGEVEVGEA